MKHALVNLKKRGVLWAKACGSPGSSRYMRIFVGKRTSPVTCVLCLREMLGAETYATKSEVIARDRNYGSTVLPRGWP